MSTVVCLLNHARDGRVRAIEQRLGALVGANAWPYDGGLEPNEDITKQSIARTSLNQQSEELLLGTPTFEILPNEEERELLKVYFRSFNIVFPLFSQSTFMCQCDRRDDSTANGSVAFYAAFNAVIAFAYRIRAMMDPEKAENVQKTKQYLQRAMSTLPLLTKPKNISLLSMQAILVMTALVQGTSEPSGGSMLVPLSIRMMHLLRSDWKTSDILPDRGESLQRARVFWTAYIFDKDYSLFLSQPRLLDYEDVDFSLPEKHPEDQGGIITSTSAKSSVNFYRLRVQLAIIENQIYRRLYSFRSASQSMKERFDAVCMLDSALSDWKKSVPLEFQAENMEHYLPKEKLVHMTVLHLFYFNCLTKVHGVAFGEDQWQTTGLYGLSANSSMASETLCLSTARTSLKLMKLIPRGNYACTW